VGRGCQGWLLPVVGIDLEGRAVGSMSRQAQVDAMQAGARHAGARLQHRSTVVALRRNTLAAELVNVERSQPAPIPRNQVRVAVARLHWGHRSQSNSRMSENRGVGAVILAAGASRRYGSPKQVVMIAGRTVLEHVV